MSDIKKINKRMEITPNKERLGGVLPAKYADEAVTLGQLQEYGVVSNKRVYKATLTQSSTNAPVATVLENTLGNVVFTYDSTGYYIGTLTGAFATASKCFFLVSHQFVTGDTGGIVIDKEIAFNRIDADTFYVWTEAAGSVANGVLSNTGILIEVYN